jgi:superfamily I DNA and/or RNA helicase
MHPQIERLLRCISLEEKEQTERFRLDKTHTLRQLKAEGLALHPLIVTRKSFGYADYPEISFRLQFPPEASLFRDGAAIEAFYRDEEPVRGILLSLEGKAGEFRLFTPDFPDWIEEDGVGIKLAPDTRTTAIMKQALQNLESDKRCFRLFEWLHGDERPGLRAVKPVSSMPGTRLNESQQAAVSAVLSMDEMLIVHGPPGTGKTTTLVDSIGSMVRRGEKILVSAPSNTAVDHISRELIEKGIRVLRVGNSSRVDEAVFPHTPEGKLRDSGVQKEIRQLKKRAEEFRRMALKYKRHFGKAEREQRSLLFREVKQIREEIRRVEHYHEEKLFEEANVIAGTPIGLYDAGLEKLRFDALVIDEAGQCIEPLAWCIFPFAEKIVLAGDHWQLPPTVLSFEAGRLGLNRSILEVAMDNVPSIYLLDTQYRMRPSIAAFSSAYFYQNLLKTAAHITDHGVHVFFIDTAGTGFGEQHGSDGVSLMNEGELQLVGKLLESESLPAGKTAIISPYAGQVSAAKEQFGKAFRVSTIDSFQGQEMENVVVSLVRSNDEQQIGFLKDYRRMNVAMTRAREKLFVIGDSATLGADDFYNRFLAYVEGKGGYRTAWEY